MGGEGETVNSMVKVGFPEKVTFSPRSERGKEPSQVGRILLPGRRNSTAKALSGDVPWVFKEQGSRCD